MKITTIALVLVAALTGCGTTQENTKDDDLAERVAKMERNDKLQKQYIAKLEEAAKHPQTSDKAPAASNSARTMAVTNVDSLVYSQPAAYQCFVSDGNPGFGGGNWVKLENFNKSWDLNMSINGRINAGGTSVIVMVPRPGMRPNSMHPNMAEWVPYTIDRPGVVTVLPAMTSCHLWTPERLDYDGTLKSFTLHATAFQPTYVPQNGRAVKHWSKASELNHPRTFTLNGQMETIIALEWFSFI